MDRIKTNTQKKNNTKTRRTPRRNRHSEKTLSFVFFVFCKIETKLYFTRKLQLLVFKQNQTMKTTAQWYFLSFIY